MALFSLLKFQHKYLLILILVLIYSCTQNPNTGIKDLNNYKKIPLKYAKRFSVYSNKDEIIIYLFGNKNISDTTNIYVLNSNTIKTKIINKYQYLKTPVNSIVSLSSLYSFMLTELGALNNIIAIENANYYNNTLILNEVNKNKIKEVQKNVELNIEQTINLNPDIVFGYGMPESPSNNFQKLNKANIATVLCLDHLESSPLARAEWIKFYGYFINKQNKADSIFNSIEKEYLIIKKSVEFIKNKPTVFTELKYGDIWYAPGGNSFMAQLLKDAGADYIFNTDTNTGSLHLSFETVYRNCKNADYWLNISNCSKKEDIISNDNRNSEFNAFKKNNLFNNNKISNPFGCSTYWESGLLYPNKLLKDLTNIFHFHKFDSLIYYKQLN